MEMSKATRTHLIYQFIILTLLFFGIGYNELLPDRKFILFLAFLPIFCYQLVILSCSMELIPIPSWMNFLQPARKECNTKEKEFEEVSDFQLSSSPVAMSKTTSFTQTKKIGFPEIPETLPHLRRWEKSVTNLGATPKCFVPPQKSKSWMNLSDSRSSEKLSSREGSLDTLNSAERKCNSIMQTRNKTKNREKRAVKAKSWKVGAAEFDIAEKQEFAKSYSLKERAQKIPSSSAADEQEEESELEKSYSFPFRQKRLQTWLEMKESTARPPLNQNSDMPYWQTVGYNLAVKYEARRRRRAVSSPTETDVPNEEPHNLRKSAENVPESAGFDRPNTKKSKSASACMNKIKMGFSNLISKKKEEGAENSNINSKFSRPVLFKLKNKSASSQAKEKEPMAMPEFPQFLDNDRPLIFYPKYIPFEKERFESDVKRKMIELAEEQKGNIPQLI